MPLKSCFRGCCFFVLPHYAFGFLSLPFQMVLDVVILKKYLSIVGIVEDRSGDKGTWTMVLDVLQNWSHPAHVTYTFCG